MSNNLVAFRSIEHNPQAFTNGRYAIHLDGYINLEHINQLINSHGLDAVNPLLSKSVNGFVYLTAQRFNNLTGLINKARKSGNVDVYDTCELIHIDHWLFNEVSYHI